jgi:hypothetical protein
MKIKNQKIVARCWAGISAQGLTLLAWPSSTVVQSAQASRCGARARRGGAAGQGLPTAPVQRGWWREHEDGEGRSPG